MSEFKRTESGALIPPRRALDQWREEQKKQNRIGDLQDRVDSLESKLDKILDILGGGK